MTSRLRLLARDARWWVADYAFAAYWQLRAITGPRDAPTYLSGEGRPVVVLPGVWETWAFLRPLIAHVHAAGHPVHVLDALAWNGRPVADTAKEVAAYVLDHDLHDVVLLAHSKGGLIGKYVMAMLDDAHRVDAMVAVCTPFSGSRYAPYLLLKSIRAFSPRDPTTLLLARNQAINARIVSIYGEFDPHIPEGSELVGARNVRLHAGGHFRILAHPRTIATVLEVADSGTTGV
ncbi:esterase/lipase family protein [Frondihabitans cladoniiphilus]|uniref:Alpha/beta hydrolase n=1 Tax=Frondihabitans cladoniiphilus TaxID=715785 RepID=A0ABP8VU58_9MICO